MPWTGLQSGLQHHRKDKQTGMGWEDKELVTQHKDPSSVTRTMWTCSCAGRVYFQCREDQGKAPRTH